MTDEAGAGRVQAVSAAKAAETRAQRMNAARWGVFHHFLAYDCDSDAAWNAKVERLDVETLADRLSACGAGFCVLTLMQNTRYLCAPNAAYARLTGLPGACSKRDLPGELADALAKRGIDLYLYCTPLGEAPHGGGWALGGCHRGGAYMADFVNLVNRNGGVVVIG